MSRTIKGSKGMGYDYGSRRPGNRCRCNSPGKGVKAFTCRVERRVLAKAEIRKASEE